jgi:ABC-type dipeptide/oligopeptide/nickel transport system permease subunit
MISNRRLLLIRFWHNRMLLAGSVVVLVFLVMAIFAPYLTGYDPNKRDIRHRFASPSIEHFMGTDQLGRDILTRIMYGARISLQVGLLSVVIGMCGGLIIGAIGGYVGGLLDNLLMRIMDGFLAFPPLLLAIGLVAAAGPSLTNVSVVIGVVYIPRFARVMRSSVLAEREKEYVEAARAVGQSSFKILFKHIGPNTLSPIIVLATIIFALAIIIEASLSFLGVGVPPPAPSWGTMLDEGRRYMSNSGWLPVWPGLAISLTVLGFNLFGDGLRDYLDPKIYR